MALAPPSEGSSKGLASKICSGAKRKRLVPLLTQQLTQEFGKGFDERNLCHVCAFFLIFPIRNPVRSELSWTHHQPTEPGAFSKITCRDAAKL